MKKYHFLIILMIGFITKRTNVNAQVVKSMGLSVGWSCNFPGIREELNGKNIGESVHQRNSVYPEIQLEVMPAGKFSLMLNASYLRKGLTYFERVGGGFSPISYRNTVVENADYFTLSITPKLQHNFQKGSVYGFAGPSLNLLKSYSQYYNKSISSTTNSGVTYETAMVLKQSVLGATIGGGITLKHNDDAVYYSLQVQYMQDLTKAADFMKPVTIVDKPGEYTFQAANRTLLLSFGVHYPFLKSN